MDDPDGPAVARATVDARWGETVPPAPTRVLTAGPVRLVLAGAAVEHLTYAGTPLLRGLAVVVRDRSWGTVRPEILAADVRETADGCTVDLEVRHRDGEVDFAWTGRLEVRPDGLAASFDGRAGRDFHRNRIGFCLLHPLHLAGRPATVTTPDGGTRAAAFPDRISPHQPFLDLAALAYEDAGAQVRIGFAGEVFETEDQRNWTDASYKTYGTPLTLPYPVLVRAGDRIAQRVTVSVTGTAADSAPAEDPAAGGGAERIAFGSAVAFPRLGLTHPLDRPLTGAEADRAAAVSPAFVHVELDAGDAAAADRLAAAAAFAARAGVRLRVAVVTADGTDPADGAAPDPLLDAVAGLGDRVEAVAGYDAASHVTTAGFARAAAARLPGVPLAGGTRAHFAELNRAERLPLDALDAVTYSIAAEVHADDRASVRETLTAQPATVRDARAIAGGRPVVVGPVGFRPRFNAVATGTAPDGDGDPAGDAAAAADQLPDDVDPRQASVFGAAWTAGVVAALAGADAIVLHETAGRRGVAAAGDAVPRRDFPAAAGTTYPLHRVLAVLAPYAGGTLRPALDPPTGLAALHAAGDGQQAVVVANLRDTPVEVLVDVPPGTGGGTWSVLAATGAGWTVRDAGPAVTGEPLALPAPAVAFLTGPDTQHRDQQPDGRRR